MIYADSSFLVSLYLCDANSAVARQEMKHHPGGVALSRIAGLEVKNAFRLALYRQWIQPIQEARLQVLFDADSAGGFLRAVPFATDEIFSEAERLSRLQTAISGNRSLDVLHIACARVADLEVFASFDGRQRKLAESVGLQLVPEVAARPV
ncbi:MAG: type II toxin-antitoxin system VapC family toxin [Opitutales bacterium]